MLVFVRCGSPKCERSITSPPMRLALDLIVAGWTVQDGRRECRRCTKNHARGVARRDAAAEGGKETDDA